MNISSISAQLDALVGQMCLGDPSIDEKIDQGESLSESESMDVEQKVAALRKSSPVFQTLFETFEELPSPERLEKFRELKHRLTLRPASVPEFFTSIPILPSEHFECKGDDSDPLRYALFRLPDFGPQELRQLKEIYISKGKLSAFEKIMTQPGTGGVSDELATQYLLHASNPSPEIFKALLEEQATINCMFLNLQMESPETRSFPRLKENLQTIFSQSDVCASLCSYASAGAHLNDSIPLLALLSGTLSKEHFLQLLRSCFLAASGADESQWYLPNRIGWLIRETLLPRTFSHLMTALLSYQADFPKYSLYPLTEEESQLRFGISLDDILKQYDLPTPRTPAELLISVPWFVTERPQIAPTIKSEEESLQSLIDLFEEEDSEEDDISEPSKREIFFNRFPESSRMSLENLMKKLSEIRQQGPLDFSSPIFSTNPEFQQVLHEHFALFDRGAIDENIHRLEALKKYPHVTDYKNDFDRMAVFKKGASHAGGSLIQQYYRRLFRENVLELTLELDGLKKIIDKEVLKNGAWDLIVGAGVRRKLIGYTLQSGGIIFGTLRKNQIATTSCAEYPRYQKIVCSFEKSFTIAGEYDVDGAMKVIQLTTVYPQDLGKWAHRAHPVSVYKQILPDLLAEGINLPLESSPEELRQRIGKLHWWFANLMPFCRGSAAVMEMIGDALWILHGFTPPVPLPGTLPDCDALCSPDMQLFIDNYPGLHQ